MKKTTSPEGMGNKIINLEQAKREESAKRAKPVAKVHPGLLAHNPGGITPDGEVFHYTPPGHRGRSSW